ncbi:endolytic transglycosylase MltG [Candidatus Uhrbacteria bacterium]|nr:endolytic transglycosylase MltG [Candidatus Uhrbacteria bacterium]
MYLHGPIRHPQGILGYEQRRKRSPWLFVFAVLGIVAFAASGVFVRSMFQGQYPAAMTRTVEIPADRDGIIRALQEAGVLRYTAAFRVALAAQRRGPFPGQYEVDARSTAWTLARQFTSAPPRREREIRVLEGWNIRDVVAYFEREGIARADAVFSLVGMPALDYRTAESNVERPTHFSVEEFPLLSEKPVFVSLEGYLFPDTYRIYADAPLEEIIRKMLMNTERRFTPDMRQEIARSGRTTHQVLTMASIIEAEVSRSEDRSIAAGILWKRRDRGMRLQVDSTVNYLTGKHDPRVTLGDTKIDSAYNTYQYPGLPRGPISNPGMDAIVAALRPKESPYWFFLTTKTGETIFSRTWEEHSANVRKHLDSK